MMSLKTRMETLADEFSKLSDQVYHYWRPRPDGVNQYIIWAEDQEANSLEADNQKQEQGIHGTIDLFTVYEFDSLVDSIQESLNALENLSWRLNSVQYEEETGLIHHEWEWYLR